MKLKKYSIALITPILLCNYSVGQNQVSLSQYMLYQPFINPSSLPTYDDLSVGLIHRSQWVGFEGAPKTNIFSINAPISKSNFNVGLGFQQEEIGVTRSAQVLGNAAYKLKFDKTSYLSLGMSLGLNNFSYDYSSLVNSESAMSVVNGVPLKNMNSAMARFGVYYVKKRFYASVFTPNLLNQSYTVENMKARGVTDFKASNIHYYAQVGTGFPLSEKIEANVSTLLKMSSTIQADLNFQVIFGGILGLGLSYRTNNEFVALMNVKIIGKLRIGYSYDYGNSTLRTASRGSHEILLSYVFSKKKEKALIEIPRF